MSQPTVTGGRRKQKYLGKDFDVPGQVDIEYNDYFSRPIARPQTSSNFKDMVKA
jgi:hypothetical protein